MYCQYFGLQEIPFSIAPNPRYLFMSERHREALAHLLYGVGVGGGFVLLTGEVGTGKTTVSRCLLEQLPENTDVAFILNPFLNAPELLATMCDELGIEGIADRDSLKSLTDGLYHFLLENHAKGRNTVLLIDEAQHLQFEVLEQIRLLTNLETNTKKLLQIIFVGQPELKELLAKPALRQLAQRITARFHIQPLDLDETQAYIRHRLQVAGLPANQVLFSPRVVKEIQHISGGIPRLINIICDRTMLGTYAQNIPKPDLATLRQAAAEVMGEQVGSQLRNPRMLSTLVASVVLAVAIGIVALWVWDKPADKVVFDAPGAEDKLAQRPPGIVVEQGAENGVKQAPSSDQVLVEQQVASMAGKDIQLVDEVSASKRVFSNVPASAPVNPEGPADAGLVAESVGNELAVDRMPVTKLESIAEVVASVSRPHLTQDTSIANDFWLQNRVQAVNELLGVLELADAQTAHPCLLLANTGYTCENFFVKNWAEFRSFNRPAVLLLNTPGKQLAYAPLIGITDDAAQLSIGGEIKTVPLNELGTLWSGDFIFIWRRPSHFQTPVALGDRAKIVEWLAVKFAFLDGRSTLLADEKFSPELAQRVRLFQIDNGLVDDGIVGIRTLLKVNEKLGVDKTLDQIPLALTQHKTSALELPELESAFTEKPQYDLRVERESLSAGGDN